MNTNLHFQDSNSSFVPPPPPPPPPPPQNYYSGNSSNKGSASGKAIWTLVLGIYSVILGWLCGTGFITAIIAWIIGASELKSIRNGQSDPAGKSLAQIGMWLGIGSLILYVLIFIIILAFGLLGGILENYKY